MPINSRTLEAKTPEEDQKFKVILNCAVSLRSAKNIHKILSQKLFLNKLGWRNSLMVEECPAFLQLGIGAHIYTLTFVR